MEEKAFRKLLVWKRAHAMTLAVYKVSEKFPKHELFGLTSQIRRLAASVGSLARGIAFQSFRRTKVLPQYLKAPAGLVLISPEGFQELSRVASAPGGGRIVTIYSKCDYLNP